MSENVLANSTVNQHRKPWGTTGDLVGNTSANRRNKKCANFCPSVRVVLIPTVEEYKSAGIADELWWRDPDYYDFKRSALQELKDFLDDNSCLTPKDALRMMYQEVVDEAREREDQEEVDRNCSLLSEEKFQETLPNNIEDCIRLLNINNQSITRSSSNKEMRPHSYTSPPGPLKIMMENEYKLNKNKSKTDLDIIYETKSTDELSMIFKELLQSGLAVGAITRYSNN